MSLWRSIHLNIALSLNGFSLQYIPHILRSTTRVIGNAVRAHNIHPSCEKTFKWFHHHVATLHTIVNNQQPFSDYMRQVLTLTDSCWYNRQPLPGQPAVPTSHYRQQHGTASVPAALGTRPYFMASPARLFHSSSRDATQTTGRELRSGVNCIVVTFVTGSLWLVRRYRWGQVNLNIISTIPSH